MIALLLGRDAPLSRFVLFFAFAILFGYLSVIQVWRLPEPRRAADATFGGFLVDVRSALADRRLRRFLVYLCFFALTTSVLTAFLVVLSKRVFGLPDNFTVFLVAIGNLGAVGAGLVNRRLIDRLGPKPMIVFYQVAALAVAVFVAVSVTRVRGEGTAAVVVTLVAFFVASAAQSGLYVSGLSYYYSLYPEHKHANLALLYSLVNGLVGTVAAYSGGVVLDALEQRLAIPASFRVLFLSIAAVTFVALVLATALPLEGQRQSRIRRRFRAFLVSARRRLPSA